MARTSAPALMVLALLGAGCRPPALVPSRALEQLTRPAPAPAGAEGPALTEEAAVALALERNVELEPLKREQQIAQGQLRASTQVDNPTVQVQRIDFNLPIQQGWQAALRWSPPKPWVMAGHYAQAKDQQAEADAALDEQRAALTARVRSEHAQLLAVEEELRVAAAGIEQRRHLADAIEKRIERGLGTRLDLLAAQTALAQATAEESALTATRSAGLERLRSLLNFPPGAPLAVTGVLGEADRPPEPAELEQRALAARPRFRELEARYDRQREEVSLSKLERVPWFRLAAGPRWTWQPVLDRTELTIGVELSFPVWNWNLGKIDVEEARLKQQADLYQVELAQLRKDVRVGCQQLESRRALVALYDKSVLPTLKARVDAANQALAGSQLDTLVLFAAEDALLAAQRARVRAKRDFVLALIELERAVGGPLRSAP